MRLFGYGLRLGLPLILAVASLSIGSTSAYSSVNPVAAAAVAAETIAIGVGRDGDMRVLQAGGDGVSNSSPILVQPYRQGSAASVASQRWTLVRQPAAAGAPKFTYQIRHPASGKCLNSAGATPVNGAAIILYTCSGASNEKWWMNEQPGSLGIQFRNLRDGRCIDIPGKNTASGVAVKSWNCAATEVDWNQYFGVRTGKFFCGYADDDGVSEGRYSTLCVEPAAAFNGLMSSWHHYPVGIVARGAGAAPNELRSSLEALTLNAQGSPHGTAYVGWKAVRGGAPTASVTYAAYTGEATADGYQYRVLPTVDSAGNPNGSNAGDGQQHTYMMLGNANGEWDIFFDYNFEGSTRYQASNRATSAQVVVDADFLDAVTFTNGYGYRARLMGADGVWRRPRLTETATSTPKTCGGFPDSQDITNGGGGNLPPWCLNGNRTLVGTGEALDVDVFTVEKPTTAAAAVPAEPATPRAASMVNGVDQQKLSRCLRDAGKDCLDEVPGLAACVAARKLCNTGAAVTTSSKRADRPTITLAQARSAAVAQLTESVPATDRRQGAAVVTSAAAMTAQHARLQLPADVLARDVRDGDRVYVITGTGPVRGWHTGARTHHRWTAVVDATGTMLFTHLHDGS